MTSTPPYGAYAPRGLPGLIIGAARTTPLGRGQMRKLLWGALERSEGTAFDLETRGARMRLHPRDNGVERKLLLAPGSYCTEETAFLARALAAGGTFLDIGANVGAFTLPIALLPGVDVIAVEPSPLALDRLNFNIAANGLANVAVEPIALSDAPGEIELTVATGDLGLSGVGVSYAGGAKVKVPTRTLSALLSGRALKKPLAIKIDVEGHEDQVLLPYFAQVAHEDMPAAIVMEVIDRHGAPRILQVLAELGYRTAVKTRANVGLALQA